ncbi:MAG: hypothetical protein R8G01_15835 [Ilumatobacteraceae bacterium]|nr:hypothetical protein [Ilumatobacteraceae bacterium]
MLACDIDDAIQHLDSVEAVHGWFSAQRSAASVTATTPSATVTIDHVDEQWLPTAKAFIADGRIGTARINGHLTVRAVVRTINDGGIHAGTEIWVHVELEKSTDSAKVEPVLRDVIERGLSHLRHELDTTSNLDSD